MKKRISIVLAASAVSALMLAPTSHASPAVDAGKQAKAFAAKQCATQAKQAPKVFRARYGKVRKVALAACVRTGTRDLVAEVGVAVETCANELIADPSGFLGTYGDSSDPLGVVQAFPNCVRIKLGSEIQARIEAFAVAGRECFQEARTDPDAFKATFGQGDGPLAALGRCIDTKLAAG
jgi:hypothetical protein